MKKMKLDLDALVVDTFDALPGDERAEGTVHAHQTDYYADCATVASGCCTNQGGVGCTDAPGCGGIGSAGCVTAGFDCTWNPQLICGSNPIAYPTVCGPDCELTAAC
ncbi:MAG TPA: hypothetical protein VFQ39_08475 [Longimicrobium sp.]|nr:hypothetical protein [Longimicrobium sp.]